VTSSPLVTFDLSPIAFFDAQPEGLRKGVQDIERASEEESEIVRFVRTPEGNGVGVLRASGGGEAWRIVEGGSSLVRSGAWVAADHVVVLDGGWHSSERSSVFFFLATERICLTGRNFATYAASSGLLTLHSTPPTSISLPSITSLFSMPSKCGHESIIGITPEFSIVHIYVINSNTLTWHSHNSLPLPSPPNMILPADPMARGLGNSFHEDDVLLSVSELGELAFWVPEMGSKPEWRCLGNVRTGRKAIRMARCSSAKKSALGILLLR
jgi:hypothetical protein